MRSHLSNSHRFPPLLVILLILANRSTHSLNFILLPICSVQFSNSMPVMSPLTSGPTSCSRARRLPANVFSSAKSQKRKPVDVIMQLLNWTLSKSQSSRTAPGMMHRSKTTFSRMQPLRLSPGRTQSSNFTFVIVAPFNEHPVHFFFEMIVGFVVLSLLPSARQIKRSPITSTGEPRTVAGFLGRSSDHLRTCSERPS